MLTPEHPGKVIKKVMGINTNGIAKQLGIAHSTASKLLRGKIKISDQMSRRVAYMMRMYSEPKMYRTANYWLGLNKLYYENLKG